MKFATINIIDEPSTEYCLIRLFIQSGVRNNANINYSTMMLHCFKLKFDIYRISKKKMIV